MGNFRGGGGGGGANCPPGGGQPQRGGGIRGMFDRARQQQQPQPTPEMTTGPQVGMRPPDQNGVRTPYDHRAMPPQATTQPVGPGGGRGMNPMMQRQMAQAQQMRGGGGYGKPQVNQRPPNPGGSRMPMRGGMRGGGRGMY